MRGHHILFRLTLGLALAVLAAPGLTVAQTGLSPLSNLVITGYGSASYEAGVDNDFPNDFSSSISPVFLYNMGQDILFESELEFGLSGEATTTTLEYAQIDYLAFDRLQIIAGKFLLPFGVFSERLHPTWINKLPNAPLLYGHAHGGVAEGAMLPMLSDAGIMGRYKLPLGNTWSFDASAWVSQGPRVVDTESLGHDDDGEGDDGHAHAAAPAYDAGDGGLGKSGPDHDEPGEGSQADGTPPVVGFGVAFSDNNKNKMLGARLGLVRGGGFEIYASGFHATYDPENVLDIYGGNLSAEYRRKATELRGEAMVIRQEFENDGVFESIDRYGYYIQVARRYRSFEPIVRWSHLLDASTHGLLVHEDISELALGITYWLMPSIPVKAAYSINPDGMNRVLLQWAYGF